MLQLNKQLDRAKEDHEKTKRVFREKNVMLDRQKEEAAKIMQDAQLEINKRNQVISKLQTEKESLKLMIKKIKNRKTVDVSSKICVNCGKEFSEKENYNWSCQKHRSTYGGHMWWCCGKLDFNAPGCKLQKHTTKDETDEKLSDGG